MRNAELMTGFTRTRIYLFSRTAARAVPTICTAVKMIFYLPILRHGFAVPPPLPKEANVKFGFLLWAP